MKQRGRKTALAVAQESSITSQERPEPPVEMVPAQRIEWISVVNACPAEWFPPETHALLAQYCRHVVASKHIDELIIAAEKGSVPEDGGEPVLDIAYYDKLLKMQERESRIIASLSTKMRLSQQATYSPQKGKGGTKGGVKSPWAS